MLKYFRRKNIVEINEISIHPKIILQKSTLNLSVNKGATQLAKHYVVFNNE
jgi:hypothetical protein